MTREAALLAPGDRTRHQPPRLLLLACGLYAIAASTVVAIVALSHVPESGLGEPFAWAGGHADVVALTFWIALALAANSVASGQGEGVVVTGGDAVFVAVAAVGGPLAAVLVALAGSTEPRELRRVPWYGIAANHAAIAISWGVGATLILVVAGPGGPFTDPARGLPAVAAGTAVATFIQGVMAAGVYAARTGASLRSAAAEGLAARLLVADAAALALGWLAAAAYTRVAWWSPVILLAGAWANSGALTRGREAWLLRHHQLTSLPNALGLQERVAALRGAAGKGLAVLYLDLDGFKAVNDERGHAAGDDVLREVGARLEAACRPGDFLAHLHGDEFLLLASGVSCDAEAAALGARLVAAVEPEIQHEGGPIHVSATFGYRLAAGGDGVAAAVREADRAMSEAKDAKARVRGTARRRN